jgi:hypothetical protein
MRQLLLASILAACPNRSPQVVTSEWVASRDAAPTASNDVILPVS